MPRRGRNRPLAVLAMPICVALAVALSFLPARRTTWLEPLGGLAFALIAPIAHPVSSFARWVIPAEPVADDPAVRSLKEEIEGFKALYYRELARNEELRERIRELQSGVSVNPELPVRLIGAPVIVGASDLSGGVLRVRIGRGLGVHENAVATKGHQLVGRVVSVGAASSLVRPVTDGAAGPIQGRVILGEGSGSLLCVLRPVGGGLLAGPLERPAGTEPPPVSPGDEVRLDDQTWPRNAQMLLIGRVVRLEPAPDNPLRLIVFVRPGLDITRVSEVVMRLTPEGERVGVEPAPEGRR